MPDVFEKFFGDFGKKVSDYYQLERLDPGYQVYFGKNDSILIENSLEKIYNAFEAEEKGSAAQLKKFIEKAADNYRIAIDELVYRPGVSPLELVTPDTIKKLGYFFSNVKREVTRSFKNPKLAQILQFPVLFLGAKPEDTPAFYNFMNFADFGLGTWHPKDGMYSIVKGMVQLAESLGVKIHLDSAVEEMLLENKKAIVTGAGGGIGRAICIDFAKEGASVVCLDINEETTQETARQVSEIGGHAVTMTADVSEESPERILIQTNAYSYSSISSQSSAARSRPSNKVSSPIESTMVRKDGKRK